MLARKLRVGFVGAGGHALTHLRVVAALPDEATIVAICDLEGDLAASRAEEFGGQPFSSADEMYDAVDLDAVFITIPPYSHGPEFGAIEHGIPFMVEKPVSLYIDQAEKIATAAGEKGVLACAGYMNRYRRGINEAKSQFADDPPVLALGGWVGGPPGVATEGIGVWWVQKDKSGGQFVEQVTHTVDLARFLCGEAVEVSAVAATGFVTGHPTYTNDDALAVTMKFESGGVANLHSCCASGSGGGVSLDVFAVRTCARFTGWEHTATISRKGKQPMTIPGEDDIFAIQDRTFLGAARTGDPSGIMSTYADAVETLRLTLAANRAAETGEVQRLR